MTYLLPYERHINKITGLISYARKELGASNSFCYAKIYQVRGMEHIWYNTETEYEFETIRAAKAHLDQYLVKDGCVLLTEKKAERLKILL